MSLISPINIPIDGGQLAAGADGFYFISNSNKFYLEQELETVEFSKNRQTAEEIKKIQVAYDEAYKKIQENYQKKFDKNGLASARYSLAKDWNEELEVLNKRKTKSLEQTKSLTIHIDERIKDLKNQLDINIASKKIFSTTVCSLTGQDGFKFITYNFTLVTAHDLARVREFKEGIEKAVGGLNENSTFIHNTMSRSRQLMYIDESRKRKVVFNPHYNDCIISSFVRFTSWLEAQINKLGPYFPPPAVMEPNNNPPLNETKETMHEEEMPNETMDTVEGTCSRVVAKSRCDFVNHP